MAENIDQNIMRSVAEGAKHGFETMFKGAEMARGVSKSAREQVVKTASSLRGAAEKFWNTEAVQAIRGFFSNIYGSIKGHIDEVLGPFKEVLDVVYVYFFV